MGNNKMAAEGGTGKKDNMMKEGELPMSYRFYFPIF